MCLENRIRKIRIQRGLSLWELAAALDTTEDALSRCETCDMGSIEADKVLAAAKALRVSPLYLMSPGLGAAGGDILLPLRCAKLEKHQRG